MPTSLGWRQRGPAHGAPGWGNVSENRWGKVSEKLSRYWGNDSEKRPSWCPRGDSNTRWQFRKLLSVSEVLDISTAPSGLAGPRRAWTAAAASETRRRSAARGARGAVGYPLRFLLAGAGYAECYTS